MLTIDRAPACLELVACPDSLVTLEQLAAVSSGDRTLTISPASISRMRRSRASLQRAVQENRLIYGVTTGFGPLAGRFIDPEQTEQLQRNLVSHLACGVGRTFDRRQTRAIMAARAINLSKGHSAVRPESVQLLLDCLNADLLPIIPSMGTVGASGDLTPLAHMTWALFGEGEVLLKGRLMKASEAFLSTNLKPLVPAHKEALAFVNGTSAMTGIAALNGCDTRRALDLALRLTVLYAELMQGRIEAFDGRFSAVRPHPGQRKATAEILRLCQGSRRLRTFAHTYLPPEMFNEHCVSPGHEVAQDPYTVRCAPQIYGAVLDVLSFHDQVVEIELNSVTDNPIFFDEDVLHGGNFYGQHVSFASDALMTAVIKLAVHSERKIARIVDEKLNQGLPPFLQADRTGLQSGFMGAQVTASAILAEMRSKAIPSSIQSIPTNANNQDVVTMGTIAARKVADMLDHIFDLLAIEALIMVQGFEILGGFCSEDFSSSSRDLAIFVRRISSFLDSDRPLFSDISSLSQELRRGVSSPASVGRAEQ